MTPMKSTFPRFSVIIPAYRAAATIRATLDSVAAQTLRPAEILIYEDGRHDNLIQQVGAFSVQAPCPVRIFGSARNRGVSTARNVLLQHATGEFVAFLDADDIWDPQHLACAAREFAGGADVVFSGVTFIDSGGAPLPGRAEPDAAQLADMAASMFRYNFVQCTSTLCLRHRCLKKTGLFDPTLSHGEDLDLWLRLLADGAIWRYSGRCTCAYRKHPSSAMGQTLLMVSRMADFYEKHLHNPVIPRSVRRRALISNRRTHARLHWRRNPHAASAALGRLVRLQPWNPVYLLAWGALQAWTAAAAPEPRPAAGVPVRS